MEVRSALHIVFVLLFSTVLGPFVKAQNHAFVDDEGVLRWENSKKEVHGFGVNYTAPFAHAYRTAHKLGVDIKKAIDDDVYHFARLGFDLYRVHVWDTEISDTLGNLLNNEHLNAFDYLLFRLKERGINYVITPIAFWDNGWPEPAEETPGFSHKYGKGNCLTHPDAIKAQENYLAQFVSHVNPYTQLAYKNDPGLIAFEVSNEPHHRESPDTVTAFIQKMINAIRETGCKKPVFYNISHSVHLAENYFKADIQGGTFQWYPTGLGFGKELQGNFLPNVDDYNIPFDNVSQKNGGAKLVYEFDAADIGKSYIYPAIARSFRTAGIQIATHFAYDPTFMAFANTEYNTHYMNLAYAPQKALSLMISSRVFHVVPLYKDYGKYPENAEFGHFLVNYEKDLAQFLNEESFIYTNNTDAEIPNIKTIESIAGYGNSRVIKYDGKGAYFIDKIEKGVWRLEVMPDAIWVDNLFGRRNSINRKVAVIKWAERNMTIHLPDLGNEFTVNALNKGNNYVTNVNNANFTIKPGTYILKRAGMNSKIEGNSKWQNISIDEFAAPSENVDNIYFRHVPLHESTLGNGLVVTAQIVGPGQPEEVKVYYYRGWQLVSEEMVNTQGYDYSAKVPVELEEDGFFKYFIVIKNQKEQITYPGARKGKPGEWDFELTPSFETKIISKGKPMYLFDAYQDSEYIMREWVSGTGMVPLAEPGKGEYIMNVEKLFRDDPENTNKVKIYDYSIKYFFKGKISGRKAELAEKDKIIIKARSLNDKPCFVQLAVTMVDGAAYGKILRITPQGGDYTINLNDLKQVNFVTLPRPYPSFLPYFYKNLIPLPFSIENAESLQISIGPGIPNEQLEEEHGIAIESVRLE